MALGNTESGLLTDEDNYVEEQDKRTEEFNQQYENAPAPEQPITVSRWALRDRLRSRVLWAAVIGCVMTVFSVFGVWEKIGVTAEGFSEIAAAVGAVLAVFGVFNDPTNREGF